MRSLVKKFLYRPSGITIGLDSYVQRPRWFYNRNRISIGARCSVGRFAVFNPLSHYLGAKVDGRIIIGDDVYIGGFSQLHAMSTLEIGNGTVLSEHVYMSDIAHGLNPSAGLIMRQPLESKGAVRLGSGVFVGFGVSVLPGVTLGDFCIVGTRSVVTRSFPPYSMIAGAPARVIKVFDQSTDNWVAVQQHENELRHCSSSTGM